MNINDIDDITILNKFNREKQEYFRAGIVGRFVLIIVNPGFDV